MNIVSSLLNKTRKDLIGMSVLVFGVFYSLSAQAVSVSVSITPLAGIVAPLLGEGDELHVILKPGQSPHGFQMTPADMKTLSRSDLLITVGTPVDVWIEKAQKRLAVNTLSMRELNDLVLHPIRKGGLWEEDDHGHHSHHHHEHHHDKHHNNKAKKRLQGVDGHLWLSVDNAKILIKATSKQLQSLNPNRANVYKQREADWLAQIDQTDHLINEALKPVQKEPFLVLHDAFQYFEKRYHLNGVGSIQLNPLISPSLKRVHELRNRIQMRSVNCVFKEPQFPTKRVEMVARGLAVKTGILDPMGFNFGQSESKKVPQYLLYDDFLMQLSKQFQQCLSTK